MPFASRMTPQAVQDAVTGLRAQPYMIAQAEDLPLGLLDPRQFELLTHEILEAERDKQSDYDEVALLAPGPDKARDLVLYRRGAAIGVVQCKRHASRIGLPALLREATKLALAAVRDPTLIPDPEGFRYEMWASTGFSETARVFIDEPAGRASVIDKEAALLVPKLRETYTQLERPEDASGPDDDVERVAKLLKGFSWRKADGPSISRRADSQSKVRKRFFRHPDDSLARATVEEIDRLMSIRRSEFVEQAERHGQYGASPYVASSALEAQLASFYAAEGRLMVLVGGSGYGKSTWAARQLQSPPAHVSVHIVAGGEIRPDHIDLVATIVADLRSRPLGGATGLDLDQAVWTWLDAANRLIIVDGLDRASHLTPEQRARWLRATVNKTRAMPLRVVTTSRPEAWRDMASQWPDLADCLHPELGPDGRAPGYVPMSLLSEAEAAQLRSAYNLPPAGRNGEALRTPSLIHHFASLRDDLGDASLVTQFGIFRAYLKTVRDSIVGALTDGDLVVDHFIETLSRKLVDAPGGEVALDDLPDLGLVPRFISAGLLSKVAGAVRPDRDELIEYLMGQKLDLESALSAHRKGRRDPLFVGSIAMAAARLEATDVTALRPIIDGLLAGKPSGLRPDFEITARMLGELSDQSAVMPEIQALIDLWEGPNLTLAASNLLRLLENLRLPLSDTFALVMRLADGEDPDDWRSKYWTDDTPGRWFTPFTAVATRLVRQAGAGLAADLLNRMSVGNTGSAVALGLLYEAAEVDADGVLDLVVAHHDERQTRAAFRSLAFMHPDAAARVIGRRLASGSLTPGNGAQWLWMAFEMRFGRSDRITDQKVWSEIAAVAAMLAPVLSEPALRGQMLMCQLKARHDPTLARELLSIGEQLPENSLWTAVRMLGDESWPLLDLIIGAAGREGPHSMALSYTSPGSVPTTLQGRFLERLGERLDGADEAVERAVSLAVEALLYQWTPPDPAALEALALQLGSSHHAARRRPLIYVSGTPAGTVAAPAPADHLARLDRVLAALVAAEDGATLNPLVWKLLQCARERPQARSHLLTLKARFGLAALDLQRNALLVPEIAALVDEVAAASSDDC